MTFFKTDDSREPTSSKEFLLDLFTEVTTAPCHQSRISNECLKTSNLRLRNFQKYIQKFMQAEQSFHPHISEATRTVYSLECKLQLGRHGITTHKDLFGFWSCCIVDFVLFQIVTKTSRKIPSKQRTTKKPSVVCQTRVIAFCVAAAHIFSNPFFASKDSTPTNCCTLSNDLQFRCMHLSFITVIR